MYEVKLTQLSSSHNNVRTKEIVGKCYNLPKVGNAFFMVAAPLDKRAAVRYFHSSRIEKVTGKYPKFRFKTLNSLYKLEVEGVL